MSGGTARGGTPGIFRSTEPAWNDRNLRELSALVDSRRVFAHIRASTGSAVQQTNCHPFRHANWLWMHNGVLSHFATMKRDLAMAVDPELFPEIEGSTDSEMLFFLALTFGLADDPPAAVARAVGLVEATAEQARHRGPGPDDGRDHRRRHHLGVPLLSARQSRSLFHSTDMSTLRHQYPDNPVLHDLSDDARLVVSEPLGDLAGCVARGAGVVVRRGARRPGGPATLRAGDSVGPQPRH